jgi:hypothetical protein
LAGTSLIFPYQWRAFWRRVLRTGRVKFYLSVLILLVWITAVALPDRLSRAAGELAAGQTASMDTLLLVLCLLWLVVLGEDLHVSVSSDRLRRFPLDVRSLLALRLSSIFLSPIAWLATIVSLLGLSPLLSARHPLLGILAALFFFALTIGVGVSVSHLLDIARRRRGRLFAVAACGAVVLASVLALQYGTRTLSANLVAANPARLVTTVANATTLSTMTVPVAILLISGVMVWFLLQWSFVRRLYDETTEPTARRATSIAWLPGRLGPLVQKEQRSLRTAPDVWMGLLPVLSAAALSLWIVPSSTVRLAIFVIVCALNGNVMQNCLGMERPGGLTRYLMFPIRGRDLFLAKNVAVTVVVGLELTLLLAIDAWQSGVVQLGADIVVAIVLLLAHLAWGNAVSVFEPRRTEPYRFSSGADPVTATLSALIGSAPGVTVIVLLQSDSRAAALAIAAIVLLTMGAYYGSLRYAGASFERRIEIISRRLA